MRPNLRILVAVILLFILAGGALTLLLNINQKAGKQQGFNYTSWMHDELLSPGSDRSLEALRSDGANWIALLVTQYSDTVASTTIRPSADTPSDEALIHAIDQAHALGLKVMLKPHVDLSNDPSHWRAQIGETFKEADWTAWFDSYNVMILHYASLAQDHGVEQFCVGTELAVTSAREAQWRKTVAGVRRVYHGLLTYAANHDGEETAIAWWDALDFIGVDAYYALASRPDPALSELEQGWQKPLQTLRDLSQKWHKPILFTEIGYRSVAGAATQPWVYGSGGTADQREQADAYRAFFSEVFPQTWFAGAFWWAWDPGPVPPAGDLGYSPRGKLAEQVVRAAFRSPVFP